MCGAETVAKCGEKVMWHWAHTSNRDCDPWWENETEWHRRWKSAFPESFREVVFQSAATGEKHRADIVTDKGMVVEVQNSPISLEEMRSREEFYENLVWIVNGKKFEGRFKIFKAPLPNPECSEFDDIVFVPSQYESSCSMFWRRSENDLSANGSGTMFEIHSTREIVQEINHHYVGHHSFDWVRPHVAWLEAKCPVIFDFGEDILWRLESYKAQFLCCRAIARKKVIHDINHEEKATDLASRFYPVANEHGSLAT